MENLPSHLPDFFTEQRESAADPTFSAQLVEIAQRFASQKRRVVFISRAWPFEDDRLGVKEAWSVPFVDVLYDHLQLLGFQVIVDKKDLGGGVQLDDAMKTSVDKADHVLMLVTRTYIHKATKVPTSGVAREVHYITHKVEAMDPEGIDGWVIAGKRRFVLPLAFNDTRGFPLADSHPGIATIFVQNAGYRNALIDLAEKVYAVEPGLLRSVIPSHANVLIQAVKKCYQEKKYIPRPFHAEPMSIQSGYVRLAIVKEVEQAEKMEDFLTNQDQSSSDAKGVKLFNDKRLRSFEQIYGTDEPIDIKNIFKPDGAGKNKNKIPKRLLVLGRAGIGKSILCQKIAHQWANLEAEKKLWAEGDQEKFKLVVWVPLRNLLDYPENSTLSDVILKECISKEHTGEKSISKETLLRGLKELKPDDILFICDGYDEVAGRTTPLIDEILAKENVFVTTRPHGINQYLTSDNARPFDRKFENIGFLDEDIENYVRAFFGGEEENQSYAQTLIQFLKTHPNIWGIAHIPINLMLICVGWKDNHKRFNLKEIKNVTITDLYYGLLVNLGRRYLDKNKVKVLNDFAPEDILEHEKCKPVLDVLSELAFQQMDHESLLIPGQSFSRGKLRKQYPDLLSLRDDVIHFGVLSPTSSETHREKTEFYFVHLTFQEFLAAFYIAEKLKTNDEEIKQYILRNKYSLRHEMVWWFVAGLLKDEIEVLEMLFDILEADRRDLAQLYHQMLLMRCMDECELKVKPQRKERYLSNLCQLIDVSLNREELFYHTLTAYLNLSEIVSSQTEVGNKFCELLVGIHEDKTRKHHLSLLKKVAHLPEKLIDYLLVWFIEARENRKGRQDVLTFFCDRGNVSVEVQKRMAAFFSEPVKKTNANELIFELIRHKFDFGSFIVAFSEVWLEIQRSIATWFAEYDPMGLMAAVYFFRGQEKISEEIQRSISLFLCGPPESVDVELRKTHEFLRYKMLKYFKPEKIFSKEILEEVQRHFVALLVVPERMEEAVRFFEKCDVISECMWISITALLSHPESKVRESAQRIFNRHRFTEISEGLQRELGSLLSHPESDIRKITVEIFTRCGNSVGFDDEEKVILEEVQENIRALLCDPNWEVRLKAADFCCKGRQASEEIQRAIVPLLTAPLTETREAALKFFTYRLYLEEVAEDIQGIIATLFFDTEVRAVAIKFFCNRAHKVSDEIQRSLATFLSYSRWEIPLLEIISFFSRCNEVSEEIQSRIAALLGVSGSEINVAVFEFFNSRKEVSEGIQKRIAFCIESTDWRTTVAAINFFKRRHEVSEEIEKKIGTLLVSPKLEIRVAAIAFFESREVVSEGTLRRILAMFILYPRAGVLEDDPDVNLWNDYDFRSRHDRPGNDGGLEFFDNLKTVPEEILRSFADLLTDPEPRVRGDALNFFLKREEVSEEIQKNIAALLRDPEPHIRAMVVVFFSGREDVSEEIQKDIATLLTDSEQWVREAAVKFFSSRNAVRKEVQMTIATLPENLGKVSDSAIEFFEKRTQMIPSVFIAGAESLMRSQTKLDKIIKILNNIAVNFIIACLELMEKENISKAFLRFFILKLLVSNLSMHQCDRTRIQVGNEYFIHFKSEEELSEFVKNFKKVFSEYTGLTFDKSEKSVEVLSDAQVVSRVGLLPAPPPNSNNRALPESSENNNRCVIC